MASPSLISMSSADDVTKADFEALLSEYPIIVDSVSATKGAKPGQRTLLQLDEYRYDKAPELFGFDHSANQMDLEAIKTLVEWKLRHGKFRPTLMNLVSSNSPELAKDTVKNAIQAYRKNGDVAKSLDALSKLKGIGPATASLLLSVHDPARVIFFSDEAFYWLCLRGKKGPIKYNAKEYAALHSKASELVERLGVSATDIEKVAYVVMKQPSAEDRAESRESALSVAAARITPGGSKAAPVKRKAAAEQEQQEEGQQQQQEEGQQQQQERKLGSAPTRRSKRTKA